MEGPGLVLKDGVTGWIDAGSQGADHIQDVVNVAKASPQPGRVLLNIGRAGILSDGDTMDLSRADVGAAREAISKNREFIVGIKARLSQNVAWHERLRSASPRAGGGESLQSSSDDPHGPDVFVDS
jgi:dihydroorotase